jgi:hypothetical protein
MEFLLPILQQLLVAAASVVASYLVVLIKKQIGVQNMKKIDAENSFIKKIVLEGVKFAEQKFEGGEKFDKAVEWITASLGEKGIKVSDQVLEGLIEAAVREFKDAFGENWGKSVQ